MYIKFLKAYLPFILCKINTAIINMAKNTKNPTNLNMLYTSPIKSKDEPTLEPLL